MAYNSSECAWKDLEIFLNGKRIGKVKKLTYKTSRETEALYGAGDDPFDINTGNKSYEGEMDVYKSVIDTMNKAAKSAGYQDLTDIPWVVVAHYKATSTSPQTTVTLPNVIFNEFEEGGENNDKSFVTNLPFNCLTPVRG